MIVRLLILLLMVLSLAGFTWLHQTDEQCVIFLKDASLSIGKDGEAKAREFLAQSLNEKGVHRTVLLPFASTAESVRDLADAMADPSEAEAGSDVISADQLDGAAGEQRIAGVMASVHQKKEDRLEGTNLAAAIEAAAGYMPPGYVPQIVLLTDGNQTTGDVVATAAQSRIPVTTIPLPAMSEPEVQVAEVNVPAEVREGEPFFVDVVVQSNHDDEGLIEVFRGDHKVVSERKPLKAGANEFRFQQSIERDRLAAFSVRISGLKQDTLLDNNSEAGLVYAAGKPRVLIIESDPNLIRDLAYALEDEGIQVDVRPPQGMPE